MTTAAAAPTAFDPTEPVLEGVTVLEASAGTGKTHAVASLVVAEVAEGRPLDELLVVTFTRKATGTLRERVWQRLAQAARALEPGAPRETERALAHLQRGTAAEVANRRDNLRLALSNFDAATIATTHGFCQQVLASLGVAGDAERNLELVENVRDLVTDAVDDLFIRRFYGGEPVRFKRSAALDIAKVVIDQPDAIIGAVDNNDVDRLRRRFAVTLRDRITDQKRRGRLITYDDLLSRLDTSIADSERGAIVAERLRRRFTMAVVDEFQDTDSVQWRILHRAFGAAPSRLVLVGDPKQAIYAFRGGDVFAYLEATKKADHYRGLTISWRSDQPLLDALDALFAGAQLGDPTIRHRSLTARPGADKCGMHGPALGPPMTVRIVDRDHPAITKTQGGLATKGSARSFIAIDLAAEAVRILTAGTTIKGTPVGPGDLAVLVRTHNDAEAARAALHNVGVPAVVHGGSSVFNTDAARHWLELLRALEQPSSEPRVHAVTLGPFMGWDATRLGTATEEDWEHVDSTIHEWAAAFRAHAVGGLLRSIEATESLTARLLGTVEGERTLSDLRHLAELLHSRQSSHPASIAALAGWLVDQMEEASGDTSRRRLESDADAVAIHTIHAAKGLEFPIVLLPSLWDGPPTDRDKPPVFHDDDGRRAIGVGASGQIRSRQDELAAEERDNEELRLLYVSLTRAKHQVVVWWVSASDATSSAFARVLLGRDDATGAVTRRLPKVPDEASIRTAVAALDIAVEDATGATTARYTPPPQPAAVLTVAPYDRCFDDRWVRTSYSGLTKAAHDAHAPVATEAAAPAAREVTEVDELAKVDEPDVTAHLAPAHLPSAAAASAEVAPAEVASAEVASAEVASVGVAPVGVTPAVGSPADPAPAGVAPADGLLAVLVPLGGLPGGARFGTLVHEMLERTDFAAADLPADLARAADETGARRMIDDQVDALVTGLALAIETPLGPAWDGKRLRDLGRSDRLDEMTFDLPLAGGDHPSAGLVTMDLIAGVFASLPAEDPLAGYHERLRDPLLATAVRGFLTGSIDLVARFGGRHVVVDYKTNFLAPMGDTPSSWHYRPTALVAAMQDAHYPLQAALYSVALHRFLRWRLADYDPERHLGGVAYLFLRGMSGPDVPVVDGASCGVFAWHPPATFVATLSDALDQGAS